MALTLFTTPIVQPLLRGFSRAVLRLAGWRVEGRLPPGVDKAVLIAAPHTSNWDLPYSLMTALALDLNLRWLGKAGIFRFPFGGLMRWLGGIPVDRSQRNDLVAQAAAWMRASREPLQLAVPPEGTRGRVKHWKTGFYYIAQQAGVPIVMAYLDYGRKVGGLGPLFQPTGDVEADLTRIKAFYAGIQGKRPDMYDAG